MRIIDGKTVRTILKDALEASEANELLDTECIAALIRRTASFCCPCSATELATEVVMLL